MRAVVVMAVMSRAAGFVAPSRRALALARRAPSVRPLSTAADGADVEAPAASPAPAAAAGPASVEPPQSFDQCIRQCTTSIEAALDAGFDLLEVEFPPLSTEALEDGAVDAYTISKENIKLACAVGEALRGGRRGLGKVALMLPDKAELDRAVEDEGTDEPSPGITIHNLREDLLASAESPADVVLGLFGVNREARVKPVEGAELYICLVFSAQELPDLESLRKREQAAGRKPAPIIAFNLKLDTLRADLGFPAFPPKDLQWRFLSRFLPVYYLRTRGYSRTISKPPFVVNYNGALFRAYPGPYATYLDQGAGRLRRVAEDERRIALGEFKDKLTASLKLDEDEGETEAFLRRGYQRMTWWEEDKDREEKSDDWRR